MPDYLEAQAVLVQFQLQQKTAYKEVVAGLEKAGLDQLANRLDKAWCQEHAMIAALRQMVTQLRDSDL